MGTTNKSEIIDMVASDVNMSKKSAGEAVDSFLNSIVACLKKGDSVSFKGFGTFEIRHRAARTGVNPQTRAPLQIPAANVPGLKFSKLVKDSVK